MRLITLLLALGFCCHALSPCLQAAGGASVQALLITASNQKGRSDPRLANYEATLRRNLPFDTYRLAGEATTAIPADGRGTVSLGQGHRLELQSEKGGGPGIRLKVQWMNGNRTVLTTSLTLQPGVPAVLGRRGGDDGEVPVVLLIAR